MRPSIYLGSRSQIIPQENQYNNESNIIKKNTNKLTNRLFILSPPVKEGKDI
jgi:hypothetical protein